jgi:hypothetical protein
MTGARSGRYPQIACELVSALGPSLQQQGGAAPFVTWDGLSAEAGAGQTLDYIFIRPRMTAPTLQTVPRAAFAAASLGHRLSDHLGIEVVLNVSPAVSTVAAIGASHEDAPMLSIAAARAAFGGGE